MVTNKYDSRAVMQRVREAMDAGRNSEACNSLLHSSSRSLEMQNALGVCWMRLGESDKALAHFRSMVLTDGGVCYREDAAPVAMRNFATALLLCGNIAGCEATLDEPLCGDGPGVTRLRNAISRWRRGLGKLERLKFALLGDPYGARVVLDDPVGEL
ncbi:MAG: hypothetical protein H6817_11300 [Phycisphaerales bacterium]|nr:hypothetical protein [Phycisphaerales bacterium]